MMIAVPVCPREAANLLRREIDDFVCLGSFVAVGEWFTDFRQVSDADVQRLLAESHPSADGIRGLELQPKR